MQVIKIYSQGFGCNSYLVTADGKNAVIIDCAEPNISDECTRRGLNPVAVLLTHGHFDHVGGCGRLCAEGVPVYCGENEADLIFSRENRSLFGGVHIPEFSITKTLKDGEEITLAGIKFRAVSTAGHTAGGLCYIADNYLFTGDTLFCGSVGRTDLPTGDFSALMQSLKKLFALEGDFKVCCGHGDDTTLDYERKHNPYHCL